MEKAGITLIALIITIIVMLILAGVSLSAVIGENGILTNAISAVTNTIYANYKEELEMTLVSSGNTPTVVGEDLKKYISSISDSDLEKFAILKGKLYYIGEDDAEKESASSVGINVSGGSATEVKIIIGSVITIEDEAKYIGTELLTKSQLNSEDWKMAIDYNSSNVEIARYGTGYYLLMPDKDYIINGETVTFSDYYVIDYENQTLVSSNNIVYWDIDSTLAVSKGLVLNIDPTNMTDIDYTVKTGEVDEFGNTEYDLQINGISTEIMKYGDVEYDSENSALKFNEDEINNPNGEGGYLKLERSGVDFSEGFTFEIYANLSRLRYDTNKTYTSSGIFCKIPSLTSDQTLALRFGYTSSDMICRFYSSSSWWGEGDDVTTRSNGAIHVDNGCGYEVGEDFYLTYVYITYSDGGTSTYEEWLEYYSYEDTEEYKKWYDYNTSGDYLGGVDLVEYYINGNIYGYTYYGADSYKSGYAIWGTEESPFFLGVCPWAEYGDLFYLKGLVYTCRLYTTSMTEDQVLESYNKTLQYRNSFT